MNRDDHRTPRFRRNAIVLAAFAGAAALAVLGPTGSHLTAPAISAPAAPTDLPKPPPSGVMGFVVEDFGPTILPGMDACPKGTAPRLREVYLNTLAEAERTRLILKANEQELTDRWHAFALGPNGTNICSQPDMFDHAAYPGVESKLALGLHLDDGNGTCAHQEFQSPSGEQGIDNQEYRAMGCTLEWRGKDGQGGDQLTGLKQFHRSGEWTQVILLKGVKSLENDPDVDVIYANTADRPEVDSKGNFLRNLSFTVNDTGARHRNLLHGRIVNGVLTTEPTEIRLAQTWGQGGAGDIRGKRSQYHYYKGRLRLEFHADGTLSGLVGGYRSLHDVIISEELGGIGAAVVAGIDCSAEIAALKKYADGMRDPKTGQCTAVSSAMRIQAVPAFITDLPENPSRIASR